MNIGLLGTDYKHTSIQDMEMVYLKKETWPQFSNAMRTESPIDEMVILATCNRFEIYFVGNDIPASIEWIEAFIADASNIPRHIITKLTYRLLNEDAIRHLLKVASGVESMVFGEDEILSQVKSAYHYFVDLESTGSILNKLFQVAIATGKRARHETEISRGAYSVSSIAVDAIRELIFDYFEKSILVIGTGTIGSRAVKKLGALGHPDLTVCNRTMENAKIIAESCRCNLLPFDSLYASIKHYDIIIVATGASQYIIDRHHLADTAKCELIIDLAVPRNVDPGVEHDGRKLLSVAGLKQIAERNVRKRQKETHKVNEILNDEHNKFNLWVDRRTPAH